MREIGARAGLLACAFSISCSGPVPSQADQQIASLASIVGRTLPDVSLSAVDGDSVSLLDRIGDSPAILFVLDEEDCVSCADFAFEARVLQRTIADLQTIFVASGPDTAQYMPYFRRHRLTSALLLDTQGRLLETLQTKHSPLALVVGDSARVLFMDFRSPSATRNVPLSPLLMSLRNVLSPDRLPDSLRANRRIP